MATSFVPSQHGFPFDNSFPPGSPLLQVPTPFGTIPIGDAGGVLCGGMVYAALDLFLAQRAVPSAVTTPVFQFLCKRLIDSFSLPFGVLRYYDWQRRSMASQKLAGIRLIPGVRYLMANEWPRIQSLLDAGMPAPLGLVKVQSFSPSDLSRNHQVLAFDYTQDGTLLTLSIYDPNYSKDDMVTLTTDLSDPDGEGAPVQHSREGGTVRAFFSTEYRRCDEIPVFE